MSNGQAVFEPTAFEMPSDSTFQVRTTEDPEAVHPMAQLLDEMDSTMALPNSGEVRTGIIVDKRSSELLVDIRYKSEGFVSSRELDRLGDLLDSLEIGDEVPVYIMREDKDGNLQLSISRALAEKDWETAEELMASQEIFEGAVVAFNRGGVIVKLGQVRGFVPASQLSTTSQAMNRNNSSDGEVAPEDRWAGLMGAELKLKVIDIDRSRNRLILSERLAMREWRRHQKEQLLASLAEGETFEGVISSIADFGAFVDLGGADGLIHLSELSWNRVSHPSEVVKVGEKVKVQILSVDTERRRIGLSLRRLQPQPWDLVDSTYEIGQVVVGRITKLVNFGAFARLDSGVEGLIHISELANRRVNHPKEIVAEGEDHELRIIRIDTDRQRMGLSLKQALPPEETVELDWEIAPSEAAVEEVVEVVTEEPELAEVAG
jgi:small subunit ribosomal protein S1